MAYQDLPPDEHPTVIKIDHVMYVQVDALPDQVNPAEYNYGKDRWMAAGRNDLVREIDWLVNGRRGKYQSIMESLKPKIPCGWMRWRDFCRISAGGERGEA